VCDFGFFLLLLLIILRVTILPPICFNLGDEARPQRHSESLCPECNKKAERAFKSPAAGVADRLGCKQSPDGSYHAPSFIEHGECC
jgi:hypothetical protein